MANCDSDEWITAVRAARIKGVAQQTITKACREGRLRCSRSNGTWLIRRVDLDAWVPRKKKDS